MIPSHTHRSSLLEIQRAGRSNSGLVSGRVTIHSTFRNARSLVIVAHTPASLRLSAALQGLAVTFRGMTARPDEYNCECHWGSEQELAQLKRPDTELELDLLRRTWQAPDWTDHASVLRRILPQFARTLAEGLREPLVGLGKAGRSLAHGHLAGVARRTGRRSSGVPGRLVDPQSCRSSPPLYPPTGSWPS